jgi:hypothetical protein
MPIPSRFFLFWGYGHALPYIRYLTAAFIRIQHPEAEIYLYQCKCSDKDKWGGVFQDFQLNGDELNKIYKELKEQNIEIDESVRSLVYDTLLSGKEPAPWDRIVYDKKKIITILKENTGIENITIALNDVVAKRKEREAKRPQKHDYVQDMVERLGVKLMEYQPSDQRVYTMPPPNVSDIFSVEILGQEGGWYLDLDQVVFKSLEPLGRAYDFLTGGQTALYIGIFGSCQGGLVVQDFYGKMLNGYSPEFYNSTGISAIQIKCFNDNGWLSWFKKNGQINHILEQDSFYPLCAWDGAKRFWSGEFDIENCVSYTCHWFGGNAMSQKHCRERNSGNILEGNDCMARYCRKLTGNGQGYKKEFCFE